MAKDTFALLGVVFTIILVLTMVYIFVGWFNDFVRKQRYKHLIKHRFDKPPIAKCYCKDCVMHAEDNECYKFDGWYTSDCWFCWDAEPREKEIITDENH